MTVIDFLDVIVPAYAYRGIDVEAHCAPSQVKISSDRYKSQGLLVSPADSNDSGPYIEYQVVENVLTHWVYVFRGAEITVGRPYVAPNGKQYPRFAREAVLQRDRENGLPFSGWLAPIAFSFFLPGTYTPGKVGEAKLTIGGTEQNQPNLYTARAYDAAGNLLQTQTGSTDQTITLNQPAGDIHKLVFLSSVPPLDIFTAGWFAAAAAGFGWNDSVSKVEFGEITSAV